MVADHDSLNGVKLARDAGKESVFLVVRSFAKPERYVSVCTVFHVNWLKSAPLKQLRGFVSVLGPHPNPAADPLLRWWFSVRG